MPSAKSRLLVVDASVARAAGETDHPTSKSCRETLLNIKEICHRIIMTPSLLDEWRRHENRFARKWLRSMFARGKVRNVKHTCFRLPATDMPCLNDQENVSLRKDAHLFEGAFEGDGTIVSLDDEAARIWNKCRRHLQVPKAIKWINPLQWRAFSPDSI